MALTQRVVQLADGRSLQLHCGGQGPALLLCPPFPFSFEYYQAAAELLSTDYQIFALQLPGIGGAEYFEYNMDSLAQDCTLALRSLGIEQCYAAGTSMGGYLAMALLRADPGFVLGLSLAATHPFADTAEQLAKRASQQRDILNTTAADWSSQFVKALMHRDMSSEARAALHWFDAKPTQQGLIQALRAMANRPDSRHELARFGGALQVIAGEFDPLMGVDKVKSCMAGNALASFHLLPRCGHLPALESVAAYVDTVRGLRGQAGMSGHVAA